MRKVNISLIGFRATGKSTVGKILAEGLGWRFIDMDELLSESFGMNISDWVRDHGWEPFREAESQLLETLAGQEGIVLATGGGAILRPTNRETLKKRFFNVWLRASAAVLFQRLAGDPKTHSNRPALTSLSLRDEIESALREREQFYEETADLEMDTEESTAAELALSIRAVMEKNGGTASR